MVLKNLFGKKDQTKKFENSNTNQTDSQDEASPSDALQQPAEPNPAVHLEAAMVENARNDTAETRAKVYQELLFSDLLLALSDGAQEAPAVEEVAKGTAAAGNPSVNVAILSNAQGVQFSAAFTSAVAARRWRAEGGQYVAIRGQDVFKLLEPSPAEVIVLNPGSAPFIVLNKLEYRQLAMGIVPQTQRSPVQVNVGQEQASGQNEGMQIAFPPDAFNEVQKQHALKILSDFENVEAAAIGAILPPNAPQDTGWLRTIFLRVNGLEPNQEKVQSFCMSVRDSMRKDNDYFIETQFEVGVMPDPNFWTAIHQNNFVLLDKSPPKVTAPESEKVEH